MAVRNASSPSRGQAHGVQASKTASSAEEVSRSNAPAASRNRLLPAAVAFGLWTAALVTLAIVSANPTTLNRAQIRVAPLVVEATLIDGERSQWRITRSWPLGQAEGTTAIEGLETVDLAAGSPYLIPVEPVGGGDYRLVLSPKPFVAPFVYPSNPRTVAALEAILGEQPPQS